MTITGNTPQDAARAALHELAVGINELKPGLFNGHFEDLCESIKSRPDSPGKTFLLSLATKLHSEGNDELFVQTVMCLKEGSMLDIGIPGTGITVSHHTVEQATADQRREGLGTYFDPAKTLPVAPEPERASWKRAAAWGMMGVGAVYGGATAVAPNQQDSAIKHTAKLGASTLLFAAGMMLLKKDKRDELVDEVIERLNPLLETNPRIRDNIAALQQEILQVAEEKKKGFGR